MAKWIFALCLLWLGVGGFALYATEASVLDRLTAL